jgi:PKD repeat protein
LEAGTAFIEQAHTYHDDDPTGTPFDTYTVQLTYSDDDGGTTTESTSITVYNLPAVVTLEADVTVAVNTPVPFSGTVSDASALDTHVLEWDMGDGTIITGTLEPTHTYTAAGVYTVTLTVTDDDTGVGSDQQVVTVVQGATTVYLPVLLNNYEPGIDLVVQSITVSANDVQIVIANIDLNLNPTTAPTGPNQGWEQIGGEGLVWGVIDANELTPGGTMTLNLSHPYFRNDLSNFSGAFANGDEVYVQVDSANTETTYGAVLERHEVEGEPYNNITAVTVSGVSDETSGVGEVYNGPRPVGQLPPR